MQGPEIGQSVLPSTEERESKLKKMQLFIPFINTSLLIIYITQCSLMY